MKRNLRNIAFNILYPGRIRHEGKLSKGYIAECCFLLIASILLGFALTYHNLDAQWGPIDDHRIWRNLTPENQMTLSGALQYLKDSEIFNLGIMPRYQPFYFIARATETYLWQDNVTCWYMMRCILLCVCICLGWLILNHFSGLAISSALIIYTLTFPCFGDVFCKLGSAETYAVLGALLYIMAFSGLLAHINSTGHVSKRKDGALWSLLLVGFIISAGSKENFLILMPLAWLLAILLKRKQSLSIHGWISAIIITTAGASQLLLLGIAIKTCDRLVYHQDVTLNAFTDQFVQLPSTLAQHSEMLIVPILVYALTLVVTHWLDSRKNASHSHLEKGFVILSATTFILLSQYFFYSGDWPRGMRYDFPYIFAVPALLATSYYTFIKSIHNAHRTSSHAIPLIVTGVFCILVMGKVLNTNLPIRWWAVSNMQRTSTFMTNMNILEEHCIEHPDSKVWVVAHSPDSYEPIFAVQRFLQWRGLKTKSGLIIAFKTTNKSTLLDSVLRKKITAVSADGSHGYEKGPFHATDIDSQDIVIQFSGSDAMTGNDLG